MIGSPFGPTVKGALTENNSSFVSPFAMTSELQSLQKRCITETSTWAHKTTLLKD